MYILPFMKIFVFVPFDSSKRPISLIFNTARYKTSISVDVAILIMTFILNVITGNAVKLTTSSRKIWTFPRIRFEIGPRCGTIKIGPRCGIKLAPVVEIGPRCGTGPRSESNIYILSFYRRPVNESLCALKYSLFIITSHSVGIHYNRPCKTIAIDTYKA